MDHRSNRSTVCRNYFSTNRIKERNDMPTIKENIANNIAELRKLNKMTQQDLAEKLNYTDKAISKWERGESTPDVESLSAIAKMFNLTVDDLLNESIDKEQTIRREKTKLSKSISKISLGVLTVWLIGTVVFVYNIIKGNAPKGLWMSFIWPIPASSLLVAVVAFVRKYRIVIPLIFLPSLAAALPIFCARWTESTEWIH